MFPRFLLFFPSDDSNEIEKRRELLRKNGERFFGFIFHLLEKDIALSICKLTDSPSNRHQQNLVLKLLIEKIDGNKYGDLLDQLKEHYEEVEKKVEEIRELRNKLIGHSDFNTALTGYWRFKMNYQTLKEAIYAIEVYLNEFYQYFAKQTFVPDSYPYADLPTLEMQLKKALAYDQLVREGRIERNYWEKV